MGASKREWESVRIEIGDSGFFYSRLREKNPDPKLVSKKNVYSDTKTLSFDRMADYYHEWTNSPDFADEMRDNYLNGNDREY